MPANLPPDSERPSPPRRSLIDRYLEEAEGLDKAAHQMWGEDNESEPTARSEPEQAPAAAQVHPPSRRHHFGNFVADAIWNARLLWRWERLRAKRGLAPLRRALVFIPELALGQLRWGWRKFKTDAEMRMVALQIAGGLAISVLIFVAWLSLGRPLEDGFRVDPSVPVPSADILISPNETSQAEPTAKALLPEPEPLAPHNFRFEFFVAREAGTSKVKLYNHTAETYIKSWFAPGTPARPLMLFLGNVLKRSKGDATTFGDSCMQLPVNKVFREASVTCTYSHPLPPPFASKKEEKLRVFWIVAMSYDRKLNIRDIQVHARLTPAVK